jgi:hypothetical protein
MLEGQNQPGQKQSNFAGDVSLNYKLTKDGRYMLRGYRRDEYIVVQGQVVETGVGFTLTVDYDRFKQIFARSKEDKAAKKRMREEKKRKKEEDKAKEQQQMQQTMLTQPGDETEQNKRSADLWRND